MSAQSIIDLALMVSTETPMDNTATFVDDTDLKTKITRGILDITNLVGTTFFARNGNTCKASKPFDQKDRTVRMVYLQSCSIDASFINNRVYQEPFTFISTLSSLNHFFTQLLMA